MCALARRLGLPLMSLAMSELVFEQDVDGVLHSALAGRVCGAEGGMLVTMTFERADGRMCAHCWNASTDQLRRGDFKSFTLAEVVPWLNVNNDLEDLAWVLSVTALVATMDTALAHPELFDDTTWLEMAGNLTTALARTGDPYFNPELRDHPVIDDIRHQSTDVLDRWRADVPGETPTVLLAIEDLDPAASLEMVTLGVVSRRRTWSSPDDAVMIVAVSETEAAAVEAELAESTPSVFAPDDNGDITVVATGGRRVRRLDGVELAAGPLIEELRRVGVGEADLAGAIDVANALRR